MHPALRTKRIAFLRHPTWPAAVLAICLALASTLAHATTTYDLDTGRELSLAGGAVLLWGLGLWADQGVTAPTAETLAELRDRPVPGIDRSATRNWSPAAATASDVLQIVTVTAPVSLIVSGPGRDHATDLGVAYLETMALTTGATYLLKSVVARPRPLIYNPDPRIDDQVRTERGAVRSFPSGHTANAFASMVFLAGTYGRLHPDSDSRSWVWGGCLAAAATTGFLRYEAGRHYPTDILAGAALGALAGWLVPRAHEIEESVAGTGRGRGKRRPPVYLGVRLAF